MSAFQILETVGLFVFILVGGFSFGWFKILKQTNVLLTEQNKELRNQNQELKDENKEWLAKHQQNSLEIATLRGKIDTLTVIPLQSIDQTLKDIVKINQDNANSNERILQQLQSTATIAAEDRDALTNSNLHIKTEVHREIEKTI